MKSAVGPANFMDPKASGIKAPPQSMGSAATLGGSGTGSRGIVAGSNDSRTTGGTGGGASGGTMTEEKAHKKLSEAHGAATDAASMAKAAIMQAMEAVKTGMANPMQVIRAILQGAAQAVRGMVSQGVQMAGAFVKSVAGLAQAALSNFGRIIARIIEAILTFKKPDFSGGYGAQSGQVDGQFSEALSRTRGDMDKMKEARLAGMQTAVQDALLTVATGFMQTAQGGTKPAQTKAQGAKKLVDEVAASKVKRADGTTATPKSKAQQDMGQVAELLGQMGGAAKQGGDAVKGGAAGLAQLGTKAGQGIAGPAKADLGKGMEKTYRAPKREADKKVAGKRQEAEGKYEAAKGKHKR
jgi:hypothetical protein